MTKATIDQKRPSWAERRRQWLWFLGLWFGGLAAMGLLSLAVKLLMGL